MDVFGGAGAGSYALPEPPDDTVSRLRFSPAATGAEHYVVAASWNGTLRCWRADGGGSAVAVALTEAGAPLLDAAWARDGRGVLYAAADGAVGRWDLGSNRWVGVGRHDASARSVSDVSAVSLVVTGGWDKQVRYWDGRSPTPAGSVGVPERVFAMDARGPLLVVATAARHVLVYDVRKPTLPFRERFSSLRFQSRCVAAFTDCMGYAIGGVDGKVAVEHVRDAQAKHDFVFRAHAGHSVNSLRFHAHSGALASAGADGFLHFWDKDRRQPFAHLQLERLHAPVCDLDFSHDGSLYAYAVGYDWSHGSSGFHNHPDSSVFLAAFRDGDLAHANGGGGGSRGRGRARRGRGGRGRGRGR